MVPIDALIARRARELTWLWEIYFDDPGFTRQGYAATFAEAVSAISLVAEKATRNERTDEFGVLNEQGQIRPADERGLPA